MRTLAISMLLFFGFTTKAQKANHLVISQVYGGGGNSGAPYVNDFIEIFNPTDSTVNLAGWSVQYSSATGTSWNNVTPLLGSIAPGHYYLIQEYSNGTTGISLPSPDAAGNTNISATDGKVLLCNTTITQTVACPTGVVDLIGYGSALCFEGVAAAPPTSNTKSAIRINACLDNDNNIVDFIAAAPNPRNSVYSITSCTTGLEEQIVPEVRVYPNPASNYLRISGDEVNEIEIYDVAGRKIAMFSNLTRIDISGLVSGMYIVSWQHKNQKLNAMFLKE